MPFPGQYWTLNLKVVVCIFHAFGIISGIFRSTYRWYISRFGWDDTWASFALLTDVGCLICAWMQRSTPLKPSHTDIVLNWTAVITLNGVPWEARLSMITSIIRIANPRESIRRMSYGITIVFGLMWIGMLSQKLYDCGTRLCIITHNIAIAQIITDGVADVLLVVTPIFFLRGVKVSRSQRVLLVSSFGSSICITILSIAQSVPLLLPLSSTSLLFTHIKAALSLVICNLLVIVTFVYRFYHKTDIDVGSGEDSKEGDPIQFTTCVGVDSVESRGCSYPTSLPNPCIDCIPNS